MATDKMVPMDIIDFLEARIAEDEAEADDYQGNWDFSLAAAGKHMLADCATKRKILARWAKATEDGEDDSIDEIASGVIIALRDVLRALASSYSDHPDYDPAWGANGD